VKFVHLVGFITKKFVTMHGHMTVKTLYHVCIYNRLPEDEPSGSHHVIYIIKKFDTKILIYAGCIVLVYIVQSWLGLHTLERGYPIRGSPGFLMQPPDTFVKYVYTMKIIQ
jgi:hypothetical protein